MVVAAESAPVPDGHYDVVVRNVALPRGVSGGVVVELPPPTGAAPVTAAAGERVWVDRIEDVAGVLAGRWPSDEL